MSDPTVDPALFRQVLGHFTTGVTVITAHSGDKPVGLAVGSFASLSLDPPLVLFCPAKTSSSWPGIEAAGHFCVNVLAEDQSDVCAVFASKAEDKFAGIEWTSRVTGAPILPNALAWIDCRIHEVVESGDHWIVIGRVLDLGLGERGDDVGPLVYYCGGYGRYSS